MSKGGKKAKKEEVVVNVVEKRAMVPLPEGIPSCDADLTTKQAYKKFSYRGMDIKSLMELKVDEISKHFRSRQRRRLQRKLKPAYGRLLTKLSLIKKCTPQGEKPVGVKTHLRDLIVLPSMVMSVLNVHTGKDYQSVEIKPDMVGYYLGEFAQSYKRVNHGRPGVGATNSSKFVPN
jgi:small subunit ribosomal protein S15e